MPWVEQLSDPDELRACIRDRVALPAMWQKCDPHQIADSVAAALLSMLHADVVYMRLPGRRHEPPIEKRRQSLAQPPLTQLHEHHRDVAHAGADGGP